LKSTFIDFGTEEKPEPLLFIINLCEKDFVKLCHHHFLANVPLGLLEFALTRDLE
jgi:hypothetical protein